LELIKTGTDGLDEVFFGGIIPNNALLIEGTPGAGKTTLGLQYIYKGALLYGQPGIIITFEEEPEKLYRDALVFGWNLREMESKNLVRVIPSSPEAVRDMLLKPESGFTKLSKSIGASRVMVDSVTHFRRMTENVQQLRVLLSKFLTGLMKLTTSAVLIKEIESDQREGANIEEYIADTVIRLSYEQRTRRRRERFLEVVKSRGQNHLSGRHTMKFTDSGLEVYPLCGALHLAAGQKESPGQAAARRAVLSTGVKGLDQICRGGFPAGSATVVAGSSGTGKTVFATHFLHEGLARGEKVLLLSFQQEQAELLEFSRSFGIKLDRYLKNGMFKLVPLSSIELSVDQLFHELKGLLNKEKPGRFVLDGLTLLMRVIEDEDYMVDYLGAMLELFSLHGVTSVFTFEVDKMFGSFEIDSRRTLSLFDNLLLLRYVELEGEIRRAVALLKMRGTDHDKSIQEYVISTGGIEVRTKFAGRVDVMGGTGAGKADVVELKDILADATRWAKATRRMRERRDQP